MKKNLIFKLCFIVGSFLIILSACSLGTQNYGKLSLSIEVPDYLKTETKSHNTRFIHPDGNILEFELYTKSRVIHTQTISLNSESESPQTVSITVDKVPYNVPLFAKITVFGEKTPTQGDEALLGFNDIYIGYLKSGNNKLTLGVKPVSDTTVVYKGNQVGQGQDPTDIYLDNSSDILPDTFNIEMFPKKGLYTVFGYFENFSEDIYLYDSEGKNYKNSFLINSQEGQKFRVFYHPEDKANTYYAYLSGEASELNGYKLAQDILITTEEYDDDVIVNSEEYEKPLGQVVDEDDIISLDLTIYNPYPFTLNLTYKIENADGDDVNPYSKDKFTFTDFPDVLVLLPGKSKKFTVNFQDKPYSSNTTYKVKSTISANGLKDFVLTFTGSTSA